MGIMDSLGMNIKDIFWTKVAYMVTSVLRDDGGLKLSKPRKEGRKECFIYY